MKSKAVKIDWDTVELVGGLLPVPASEERAPEPRRPSRPLVLSVEPRAFSDRRGQSSVKKIVSGATVKARTRGAMYTHTQLRTLLPAGMEMFIYGWSLLVAAIQSERDMSMGVDLAAHAICTASLRVSSSAGASARS